MSIVVERVPINRQGYDSRGKYHGAGGDPLYAVLNVDTNQVRFVRAKTPSAARSMVTGKAPRAKRPSDAKKRASTWDLEKKIADAREVRSQVAADMRPLFDHLLVLARGSYASGYKQRAGREISTAKRMATKYPAAASSSRDRSRRRRRA